MSKLTALPSQAIVSGFRGVIDYYVHHQTNPAETGEVGTPCARRWPRSPGHRRSQGVEAQWQAFTDATRYWKQLSPQIRDSYFRMAQASGLSGYDLHMRAYLSGLYYYPH